MTMMVMASRMEALGAMLKKAREAKGLFQRQLANLLDPNLEGSQVWRWEKGKNLPTADRLSKIIAILDLDPDLAWRAWGEAQVKEIAEAVSAPVEEAVGDEPDPHNESSESKPARGRKPRAR